MKITELTGEALERAIKDEIAGEWNGKKQDRQTIIGFSLMNDTNYDSEGRFVDYGNN